MRKILLLIFCLYIGGVIMSNTLDRVEENIFQLKSTTLKNNEQLPLNQVYKGYGCEGKNLSPQLSWKNPPLNTKSFALICHDPDAPKENGWYHWIVINIPKTTTEVKEGNKILSGTELTTDFNTNGYGGACPPKGHGTHHYNFTIYALNTEKIDIPEQTKPWEIEQILKKYTIAKSTITALYERK